MPGSMVVHDTRLEGTAPVIAPNIYRVDETVSMVHALGWIARYASMNRGLRQLTVMCHGLSGPVEDTNLGVSTDDLGFGLLFCRENLTLLNVMRTNVLEGLVQRITLFACGSARTRPGYENSVADGHRLCSELAGWTGAEVIAAVDSQTYTIGRPRDLLHRILRIGPDHLIDFGPWEGNVFRFLPNGHVMRTCG